MFRSKMECQFVFFGIYHVKSGASVLFRYFVYDDKMATR